ncbi:MAG: HAD family hydrolase [Victivallales bacterium]|nr:HAD family hydrolase [Victivallales bacterium]
MYKALLFDFDGTLADTYDVCVQSFYRFLLEYTGRKYTREEIIALFGYNECGVIAQFIGLEQARSNFGRFTEIYQEEMHAVGNHPFDGIPELLSEAKSLGYRLACSTGKCLETAKLSLEYFGIASYFEAVSCGFEDVQAKTRTMSNSLVQLGLQASECLYVGDAPTDVTSAHPIGLAIAGVAWAPTTNPVELQSAQPDHFFLTTADFAAFLRENAYE